MTHKNSAGASETWQQRAVGHHNPFGRLCGTTAQLALPRGGHLEIVDAAIQRGLVYKWNQWQSSYA